MPSRILREGLLDSDVIGSVTPEAEMLFVRILLLADDYGRYDGRVSVICRRAFVNRRDIDDQMCAGLMDELVRAGLIEGYVVDAKPYIVIPTFNQRTRSKKSKFPDRPIQINQIVKDEFVSQMADECQPDVRPPRTYSYSESESESDQNAFRFAKFWAAYPRKTAKLTATKAFKKLKATDALMSQLIAALDREKESPQWRKDSGQFIPHAATWLNQHRWEDETTSGSPSGGDWRQDPRFKGALCEQ